MSLAYSAGLLIWLVSITLTVLGTWLTLRHFRTPVQIPKTLPSITILKPCKGADEGFAENLENFFKQDYPEFEILFCVAERSDPAVNVIRSMIKKYPRVDAKLNIGSVQAGPNPKVNNMMKSYDQAKNDWLLISDSNVRVPTNYVARLVAHLDPSVGIVTASVAGLGEEGVGGWLESMVLNTFFTRGMILAAKFGKPCVLGKSMLFRKSVADRFGGMRVLARYLAEDFMAGEAMRRLGYRVVIAHDPLVQHVGKYSFDSFWSRHLRWGRIRKSQAPHAFATELLFSCMISGVLGAIAMNHFFATPLPLTIVCHLFLWSYCDLLLIRQVGAKLRLRIPAAWFMRELLAIPLWFAVASGNTVNWRGKKMKILVGGLLDTVS